jgi:pimeloyl-ACP methyl ester carboxylesterase
MKTAILKTGEIELFYKVHGESTPLVLISGFTVDHSIWDSVAGMLSKKFKVITFDNRGVGQSSVPNQPYTIEMLADDTAALIQAVSEDPVYVVGQSMGGAIAQNLAYRYPQLVQKLIIANSFPFLAEPFRLFCESKLEMYDIGVPHSILDQMALPWAFSNNFLANRGLVKEIAKIIKDNPLAQTACGYRNQWRALSEFNSVDWLEKIRVPTKIIAGECDIISSVAESEVLASKISNSTLSVINGVGHASQIEKPNEFVEIVESFFLNPTKVEFAQSSPFLAREFQ